MDLETIRNKIQAERQKQTEKRGYTRRHDAEHSSADWALILAHEVGCLSDIALNYRASAALIQALVKIAAVAHAALEALPEEPPYDN